MFENQRPYFETDTIANDINRKRRKYFIHDVKDPLNKALLKIGKSVSKITLILALIEIIRMARKFPVPTKENTRKTNTHVLLGIWDEFFEYEHNPGRKYLFEGLKRLSIGMFEHSSYYTQRGNWWVKKLAEKVQSKEWKPDAPWNPSGCWLEPNALKAYAEMMTVVERETKDLLKCETVKT